jgi:hypothetical protein
MVALDMLGRRGALRLLWELRDDPLTFRALQDRRRTLLTAGIGCSSQPSWVSTPAAMNAATKIMNQMPTMVSTVVLLSPREIGCFPRKRSVSLEKYQAATTNS